MVLVFGPFELDTVACELRRAGRTIALQPRVFDTLRYLAEHRDRLVGKRELIDALWGGQQLNSVAVPWSISHARKALGQNARGQTFIETVRGRGYRFVAEVKHLAPSSTRISSAPPAAAARPELTDVWGGEPFVGRETLLAQLIAAVDAARSGRGGLFLLTGEAGSGKTRCLHELTVLARRRGLRTWSGRGYEQGAPAFWPLIQVLREAASDSTLAEPDRSEVERLLEQLIPPERTSERTGPASTSDDARFWLLDRLSRCFAACAATRMRLIVLDDLHHADETTLKTLALLAPQLARCQLLVVATARDALVPEPEPKRCEPWARLSPCERLPLPALAQEDVEQYLAALLGESDARDLGAAVHARTAGNPLFMRESVRLLAAQRGRSGTVSAADVRLPDAARKLFDDRLAALDPDTRALLDVACVLGDELDLPLLQRAIGWTGQQLLTALDAAETANMVEQKGAGPRYGFVHPLLREVLYAALPVTERGRLHAELALALEALSLIEPRLHQLAYHFHHAPVDTHGARAVRYARLAGDAAMRVYAYDEAVECYAWALAAQPYLGEPDPRASCELILASAAALLRAGRRKQWRAQTERAIALAREHGLADLLVQGAQLLRPSVTVAQLPDALAVSALEEALTLLPQSALGARAQAYCQLACLPPYATNLAVSRQLSDEAMRLAQVAGDPRLVLEARRSRLRALSGPDSSDELLELVHEIIKTDPSGASWWSSDAQIARYHTHLRRGELDAAERALDALGRMARALNSREWSWHHQRLLAQRSLQGGRLDEAEQHFNELWDQSQRLRLTYGPIFYGAQLNALSLERTGRRLPAGFKQGGPDAWKWAREVPAWRAEHILFAIETGELNLARSELRATAEHDFAAVTRDSNCLYTLSKLALAAVTLEDRAAALALHAVLSPYAALFAVSDLTFSLGSVAHYLGLLARFLHKPKQAREHFEAALETNRRCGHLLHVPRNQLALAQLLGESRAHTDRKRAQALVSEVFAAAELTGSPVLRAAAASLSERLS